MSYVGLSKREHPRKPPVIWSDPYALLQGKTIVMPSRRRVTHGNSRNAHSHRRRGLLCCIVTALAGIIALVEYNLTARLSDHLHFEAEKNIRSSPTSTVSNDDGVLATAEESQVERYRHQAMEGDTRITAYNSSTDGGESSRGIGLQTVTRLQGGECHASDCRVLITGCGRSGTHFLAEQLASAGVPIAHETIGKAGSISWLYAAPFRHDLRDLEEWFSNEESVKLRAGDDFQLFPVFHLVRHPLAAVASLTECFCGCGRMSCGAWADPPSWKWAGKFVEFSDRYCSRTNNGEVCVAHTKPAGRMIRSMEYWLEWNHLAESQAHFRIQLETVKLSEVAQAALQMDPDGLLVIPETFVQNPFASKRGRGPTRQTVSWEMMQSADATLEARVWELAQSYGYSRDPP